MNNKRAIYKFRILEFSIFKIGDIGLLWSKITIFIIEISQKLHLHTKYGWNNPNSRRLVLKSPKFHFLPFLAAQKFISHANIQIHVTSSIFIVNILIYILEMLVTKPLLRSAEERELMWRRREVQRKLVVKNFSQTFVKNAFYYLWIRVL